MITAGIPTVFVNAEDIGYTGTELREQINTRFEAAGALREDPRRRRVAHGLIKSREEAVKRQHTPKIAFVAKRSDYVASSGRRHLGPATSTCWSPRLLHGQAATTR